MITKQEYTALEKAVSFYKNPDSRTPEEYDAQVRKMERALDKLARELMRE